MKNRCINCANGTVNKGVLKIKKTTSSYAVKCNIDKKNKHKDYVCSYFKKVI